MKPLLKILGVVVAVAVILLVAASVLIKFIVTPEQVRKYVLPLASKELHRNISIEDIDISLWSGIDVKKVLVQERVGDKAFVSADKVRLSYQLLPLLSGKLVIDEVLLDHPVIRITREKDGTFNFNDLTQGGKEGTKAPSEEDAPVKAGEKTNRSGNFSLLVSSVSINGGEFSFTDKAVNQKSPFNYKLTDFNLNIDDFSLKDRFPIKIEAKLHDAPLKISGEAALSGPEAGMHIVLERFNVVDFAPYFAASVPGKLSSINTGLNVTVDFKGDSIKTAGVITLSDLGFTPKGEKKPLLNGEKVAFDYDLKVDIPAKKVEITKGDLNLNGILCSLAGMADQENLDMNVTLPEQQVEDMVNAIPPSFKVMAESFRPGGAVEAGAALAGPIKDAMKLLQNAHLSFKHVTLVVGGGIPVAVDGKVLVAGNRVTTRDLAVTAGKKSRFDIDVRADNIMGRPIKVKGNILSRLVDLDEITGYMKEDAPASQEDAPEPVQKGAPAVKEEPGPFDIPVVADGAIRCDLMKFKGMDINNLVLAYHLKDNRLHLDQKAGFGGGTVKKISDLNLAKKGLEYTSDVTLKDIQASRLIKYLASPEFRDVLSGSLDFNGHFQGFGVLPDDLKKNLTCRSTWQITKGRLAGQGLVKDLGVFLGIKELENIKFDKADGNLIIEKGDMIIKGAFSSDNFQMRPQGKIALSGPVDLYLNAKLSPELAEKMNSNIKSVVSMLKDKNGWVILPLKVTGEYMSPSFTLDEKVVKEKAAQEGAKQLNRLIFGDEKEKKGGSAAGSKEKGKGSTEDVINNTLKSLFK